MALEQDPRWVPTEIIVEILLKVPLESLLRCKSVCKLWHSLISEQRFIKSYLTLAPCNTRCRFITSFDNYHTESFRLYDHVVFGKSVNVVELDNPFTPSYARNRIIGSFNGLLCVVSVVYESSTIFIWNPSTRRVNRLPSSGNEPVVGRDGEYFNPYVGFGFGYDEFNDDYKVVEIIFDNPRVETRAKIYSLKSGCWKRLICDLTSLDSSLRQQDGMFLNGALHWYVSSKFSLTIVSFDLVTETFGEILQPVYDREPIYLTLCTFGEWLSVVCDVYRENRLDVWVMKVYGVQDSWTKLVSIPHQQTCPIWPRPLMTLCITEDGKFLLNLMNKLVLYDPKNGSFSVIQEINRDSRPHTFVESLVSPMPAGSQETHGLVSPMLARSQETHGFFNSIILRFKKICAPGHILSCLAMPNVD